MNILSMNKKYMFYTSETNTQVELFIKHNKQTNKENIDIVMFYVIKTQLPS